MPLFQDVFNEKAPRLSKEAQVDFTRIGKWFIEDLFTYVRVYGSIDEPHVLPLYVLDKLLAREIAYQTVGHGLTKSLREEKKDSWPTFPIHYVVYAVDIFKHDGLEIDQI